MSDTAITLADGTKIGADGKVIGPSESDPLPDADLPITLKRRLADLPLEAKRMNGVMTVTAYHLYGLPNSDIAHALNTTTAMIDSITKSDVFREIKEGLLNSLIAALNSDVRGLIQNNSRKAANELINLLRSDSDVMKLNVARDILDRSGHTPKQIVEHQHSVSGGLRIEYVTSTTATADNVIDVEVSDAEHNS